MACQFSPLPELAAPISGVVRVDRIAGVLADGQDKVMVTIRLRDYAGNVVPGIPVRVRTDPETDVSTVALDEQTEANGAARTEITTTQAQLVTIEAVIEAGSAEKVLPERPTVRFVDNREATVPAHTSVEIAVGAQPHALATADLNNDGFADLLVANAGSNDLTVVLGGADRSLSASQSRGLPGSPRDLATADLDGDGNDDAIVALASADLLYVLLGVGDGTFAAAALSTKTETFPRALAVADLVGDETLDIAVASANAATVTVYTLGSTGELTAATSAETGLIPADIAAADVNGDGRIDLVVANQGSSNLWYLESGESDTFTASDVLPVASPTAVVAADLNSDGQLDFAAAGANDELVLFFNTAEESGSLEFTKPVSLASDFPLGLEAVDLNGDGHLDLLTASARADSDGSYAARIRLGDGYGGFEAWVDIPTGTLPVAVAAADFNADGALDIAVANTKASTVTLVLSAAASP